MDVREVETNRRSSVSVHNHQKKYGSDDMRRPFGVAAKDVTAYINGKYECDLENEFSIPFYK